MVLILDLEVQERFELEEYVEFVKESVDTRDYDSLAENAWSLRALANNRSFLLDFYHNELRALYDRKSMNLLTPQSVSLAKERDFFVRANVWLPANADPFQRSNEQKLYA